MNYEYCDGVTHTIKKGDTLYEISRKYNVALALLLRANPYVDVFNLQVGDTICIPTSQGQMTPYPVSGMTPNGNTSENMTCQKGAEEKAEGVSCKGVTESGMIQRENMPSQAEPMQNVAPMNNTASPRNTTPASNVTTSRSITPVSNATTPRSITPVSNATTPRNVTPASNAMPMSNVIPLQGNVGETEGEVFEEEEMNGNQQKNTPSENWEKYVVNPGDTLADVLQDMNGDMEKFLKRNDISTIYMLPGVAYYICK